MSEGLRATLKFLEKMTLDPLGLVATDADAVRAAGVSDDALEDAIWVAATSNIYDRLADALGWDVPPPEVFEMVAPMMLTGGYKAV